MADVRTTQQYIEIISPGPPAPLRVTQQYIEIISPQIFFAGAGNADGLASVLGGGPFMATTGNADGQATANGATGVAAVGHADGYANVFSGYTPGQSGSPMIVAGI